MDALATLALRFPEVPLVLAHAAVADQGMFASRLAGHPRVLYDTACMSPGDVVELFARVPAERIVFASDVPYGRPVVGLYQALRVARLAGLDAEETAMLAGGTMAAVLAGRAPAEARPPRLPRERPVDGALLRVGTYLMMGFAAVLYGAGRLDIARMAPGIALARCVCRDPDPGPAGPALARIDAALARRRAAARRAAAAVADGLRARPRRGGRRRHRAAGRSAALRRRATAGSGAAARTGRARRRPAAGGPSRGPSPRR